MKGDIHCGDTPGLYACSLRSPADDEELSRRIDGVTEPWFAVLASFGLDPEEVPRYHRVVWAAIHGFVTLRAQGLMTRAADPDRSSDLMIDLFADSLQQGA